MLPLSSIQVDAQRVLRRLTIAVLALIVGSGLLHAETPVPPPKEVAEPVSPRDQLQKTAEELAEQRKQLATELDATKHSLPKEIANQPPRPKLLDLFQSELNARQTRGSKQLEDLRTQLRDLEKAITRQQEGSARQSQAKTAKTTKRAETGKSNGEAKSTQPAAGGAAGPQNSTAQEATPVVTEPVDRLGLANNLYATGNYKLALATYQKIPLAEATADDRVWIEYQLGCCNRNLGDVAEAEKHYRVVASRAQPEFLTEYARWWLDSLGQRKQIEKALTEVHPALEALEKQINESKDESKVESTGK